MRDNVRAFVEIAATAFDLAGPVYEFGSYLVEGQQQRANLRGLFPGRHYIGCDLREGPGVDRVEDLSCLSLPDHCAKTVLCLDTIEHVFEARRAMNEMIRVLAPGGVLLVAAPMDFRVHDYPADYWRLTPSCMARMLAPLEATIVGSQGIESYPHTVFGIACKTPVSHQFARGAERFLQGYQGWLDQKIASRSWRQRLKQRLSGWLRSKGERRRLESFHTARFAMHLPARQWLRALAEEAGSLEPAALGSRLNLV
jgi:SAM-dependent methyltransferase